MFRTLPLLLAALAVPADTVHHHRKPDTKRLLSTDTPDTRGNWCYGDCLTMFEKAYLKRNSTLLQTGLEALRMPGCVTPGRKIMTVGMYRSASTLLFNQARLWMNLAFPGNVSQGYEPDPKQFDSPKHSVVVGKTHFLRPYTLRADVVLTSRRSVVDMLSTRVDMGVKGNATVMKNQTAVMDIMKKECKLAMGIQERLYTGRLEEGLTVDYDVLLSHYERDPQRQIVNIAKALGVCDEARGNHGLINFIAEAGKNLCVNAGVDNGITQMHRPMEPKQKETWRPIIQDLLKKDPNCSKWASDDAQLKSNKLYTKPKP